MVPRMRVSLVSWLLLVNLPATAQENEPAGAADGAEADSATHDELRQVRDALTKAVEEGDVEAQLAHASEDIVTTWQNNEVARGPDGLRDFLNDMETGGERVFQGYKSKPTADDRATVYGGDTAIATGTSVPHSKYLGMEFDLENRWTATLVKENDEWKIAAYHVSANVVNNPLLSAAKRALYWTGGVALVVGMLLGGLVSRMMTKNRTIVA
jgi:ketosteroid isomerase-like protein